MLMLTDTDCRLNTTRIRLVLQASELQNRLSPIARHGRRQDAEGIVSAAVLTMLFWITGVD